MEKFAISIKYVSLPKPIQGRAYFGLLCGNVEIEALSLVSLSSLGLTISKCSLKQKKIIVVNFFFLF